MYNSGSSNCGKKNVGITNIIEFLNRIKSAIKCVDEYVCIT